jgi:hypothetical protein
MADDFSELGRQVYNRFKSGSTTINELKVSTDAFELSQNISSELPVKVRQFFSDSDEIQKVTEKLGYEDPETVQWKLESAFETRGKWSFISNGRELFRSEIDAVERASGGQRSKGLNTYLNILKIDSDMGAKDFSELTGLPVPDQIGKGGLPALKRRFKDGEELNADLDDVKSLSDFFRAYGINDLTIKPVSEVKKKAKETVDKTVKNDDMSKNSKFGLGLIAVPLVAYTVYRVVQ